MIIDNPALVHKLLAEQSLKDSAPIASKALAVSPEQGVDGH
jgi:hypothetical protein